MVGQDFWDKVEGGPGQCWTWTGVKGGWGKYIYGTYKGTYAHRLSYELMVDEIPEGYEVDHMCQYTLCVNPYHLRAIPMSKNRGGFWRGWCKSGHAMIPGVNKKVRPNGTSQCHLCTQRRNKARANK